MRLLRPETLLCLPLAAGAAFDPVKDVAITVSGGILAISLPAGAHLKAARFNVVLRGPGNLKVGPLPKPSGTDEAGDSIWRGAVAVPITGEGLEESSRLEVTYQPCTEGPEGRCYLSLKRVLKPSAADLRTTGVATAGPSHS